MNAVVLLPTLNRTALLKNFLSSYKLTNATVPVWILVDDNDYLKNQDEYEAIKAELPSSIHFKQTGSAVSMGAKVRSTWKSLVEICPKWVGLLNDDHFCVTPNWDEEVDRLIDGTNMVSTNDGSWNFGFNVVGLTAWSFPLLEQAGFPIFPEGIDHWFIDNVWKAIGESTGCWLETMKVNIEHRHAFIGKSEQDETFKLSQDPQKAALGQKAFKEFMENDFETVCLKIVKFREKEIFKDKFN